MVTPAKKTVAKKKLSTPAAAARRGKSKAKPNRLGIKLGYAAHLCRIRPGYDLIQPTYPVMSR
jgi:hypothetical protein